MSRGERSTAQRTPLKAAAAATHTGKIARARARARVEILAVVVFFSCHGFFFIFVPIFLEIFPRQRDKE